ncbi:MAG: YcxB family protein, partial [Bacilli bacterium]|nr:YcxB family protein [Bacilli bacterium]
MKLQKKFRIDQDAYVEFCKKTTGSRNYITVAFTSVAIIVISAIFKFSDTYLKSALIGLIYAAIYAVIVIVFSYFTTVSSAKRAYEKNQFAKYRILLTFDERGLVQQTPSLKDFVVTWKEFFKVIETKLSFIFYVNRKQAVLVSKKALKEAEIAKLREIIFEYGTKNNVKLKLLPRQEELAAQIP